MKLYIDNHYLPAIVIWFNKGKNWYSSDSLDTLDINDAITRVKSDGVAWKNIPDERLTEIPMTNFTKMVLEIE